MFLLSKAAVFLSGDAVSIWGRIILLTGLPLMGWGFLAPLTSTHRQQQSPRHRETTKALPHFPKCPYHLPQLRNVRCIAKKKFEGFLSWHRGKESG